MSLNGLTLMWGLLSVNNNQRHDNKGGSRQPKKRQRDFEQALFGQRETPLGKGVPGLESRTVGWLVSPAEGRQNFFWTSL